MSWDINQAMLLGRLTKDPEIRYSQAGLAVTTLSLAVGGKKSTRQDGKSSVENEVSYFDLVSFGKTAELSSQYLSKGKQVAVLGYLRQRRWEDQNGQKRSKVEIVVTQIQFLGSPAGAVAGQTHYESLSGDSEGLDDAELLGDDVPF